MQSEDLCIFYENLREYDILQKEENILVKIKNPKQFRKSLKNEEERSIGGTSSQTNNFIENWWSGFVL